MCLPYSSVMNNPTFLRSLAALLLAMLFQTSIQAALKLPQIFASSMVLQRDQPVAIWGWAEAGQDVTVSFAGQSKTTRAGADGKWRVALDALPASSENRNLEVSAGSEKLTYANVLVGEVWLCSGQSNMEWVVNDCEGAAEAAAAANNPLIRHFKAALQTAIAPQEDLTGAWAIAGPETVPSFTATGYYFTLNLYEHLKVPIGIVNSSWGGSQIEPWIDPQGFSISPQLKDIADRVASIDAIHRQDQLTRLDEIDAWSKTARKALIENQTPPAMPAALPPHPLTINTEATSIYNAMIAPLVGYGIRGVLWYQGESNRTDGMLYSEKMKALIGSWRRLWDQAELPFYFVQLAPYGYGEAPENLPRIWEAQTATLAVPHTGMAVTNDIGTPGNIHPPNKTDVGKRLALLALSKNYGFKDLESSGPMFKKMKIKGNKIVIQFEHAKGLKSRNGTPLTWFTIAGEDKNFVEAKAEIDGKTVVVSAESVKSPVAVRFGWNERAEPNLSNGADLPASAFRTDNW